MIIRSQIPIIFESKEKFYYADALRISSEIIGRISIRPKSISER